MKLLNKLGTRVLSMFVADAGACVPGTGTCCYRWYRQNCYGNCTFYGYC